MPRPLRLAAVGLLAAAAIPATAAATTSTALLFGNAKDTCGIKIHAAHKPATEVLCSAAGIPRPKHGGPVGDPFVQIGKSGAPQLVLISQASYVGHHLTKLSKGTLWSSIGVACNIGSNTILCFNNDNHGFVIGNGKYTSF